MLTAKGEIEDKVLGLAIAISISEQLGGKLTAKSTPNEKTTFMFQIKIIR